MCAGQVPIQHLGSTSRIVKKSNTSTLRFQTADKKREDRFLLPELL